MIAPVGAGAGRIERHGGDGLRIVLGLVILGVATVLALPDELSALERNALALVNQLPDFLYPFFNVVQQAGAFPAVAVAVVAALAFRRPRLALAFVLAGPAAWFGAKGLKALVDRERPFVIQIETIVRGAEATGLGFPSGHAAVSATLATVLGPYLPRWGRRAVWIVVFLVGTARVYVGAHLPLDVFGGWAIGWVVGATVNLVVGTPVPQPNLDAVRRLFAGHGFSVEGFEPVGPRTYRADRRYFVKVRSDDERDADVLWRLWRRMPVFVTARQATEHEALVAGRAAQAGVRTPAVVLAGPLPRRQAVLATDWIEGHPVDAADAEQVAACRREVSTLHAARIAHGALSLASFIAGEDGAVWVTGFAAGTLEASDDALARDAVALGEQSEPG